MPKDELDNDVDPLADDVDLEDLARRTDRFTGADLEDLTRRAGLTVTRRRA